jgi:hypothetical protein
VAVSIAAPVTHDVGVRRRLALPAALVAVAALAAAATAIVFGRADARDAVASEDCTHRLPAGGSVSAAHEATAVFVRTVVLRRQPLGSARLRRAVDRGRWAAGDMPVRAFASRYPPTAYRHASRDPQAPQAVYVISRSAGAAVVSPLEMIVGLAAPDAGLGAYRVVLVLDDDGNWRVDRWWRVQISSRDV